METVIRVTAVYVLLWAAFRVLGKRELKAMSPFELVTLLFISQLFSRALTRADYSFTNAIIGSATMFALLFLTSALSYRFRWFARVVKPSPTILVARGALVPRHMDQERIETSEIFSEMHKAGLTELDEVEWAILESMAASR